MVTSFSNRKLEAEKRYSRHVIDSLRHSESEEINMDLIVELVIRICKGTPTEEAILIFLPGWDKISKLNKFMAEDKGLSSCEFPFEFLFINIIVN